MTHSRKPRSARAEGATPSPSMGAQERRYGLYTLPEWRAHLTNGLGYNTLLRKSDVMALLLAAEEGERAGRLIRTLCNKAKDSPGCLWPKCDCGEVDGRV